MLGLGLAARGVGFGLDTQGLDLGVAVPVVGLDLGFVPNGLVNVTASRENFADWSSSLFTDSMPLLPKVTVICSLNQQLQVTVSNNDKFVTTTTTTTINCAQVLY